MKTPRYRNSSDHNNLLPSLVLIAAQGILCLGPTRMQHDFLVFIAMNNFIHQTDRNSNSRYNEMLSYHKETARQHR